MSIPVKPVLVSAANYAVALAGDLLAAQKPKVVALANTATDHGQAFALKVLPSRGLGAAIEHGTLVSDVNQLATNLKAEWPGVYDFLTSGLVSFATALVEQWAGPRATIVSPPLSPLH